MSQRMCKAGHDTHAVGRDMNGGCSECRRIAARKRHGGPPRRRQFCPHNHDTYVVGRYANGRCRRCQSNHRSRAGFEEMMVRQEQLPFPPLRKAFALRSIPMRSLSDEGRQLQRYAERGHLPVLVADWICTDVLGVHPCEVYGPTFFDLKEAA